jgi:anaphase-promoting complex subunit 5
VLTEAQALENGDVHGAGTLYSHMGDAYMGLAGADDASSPAGLRLRAIRVSRAEVYIDRARECKWQHATKWPCSFS